jgi:hypothetical protein
MNRKRIPNGKNTLSSPWLQMAKATQERQWVIFIGLAREASHWKSFPEKV